MNVNRCKWLGLLVVSLTTLLVMGGCGGSSSSKDGGVGKATIRGSVSFPSLGNLVAKRVGSLVTDDNVTVQAYDLSGNKVGLGVKPTYDGGAIIDPSQRLYSYSIPNLPSNTDYVIKVTRGTQILKKLIEKKDVPDGDVKLTPVDAVSTVAVMVASQKLSTETSKVIVLGDALPTGTVLSTISGIISDKVKPALLEGSISAAVTGASSTLTVSSASYANLFNVVVTAVVELKDPNAVVAGTVSLSQNVTVFSVAGTIVTPTVTPPADIATTATSFVTDSSTSYVAPTTVDASTYTNLAKQYLAVQDISNAALNYEKALVANPDDAEANFGGAITSGMMMLEDPDVQAIITKWGAVVPTVNQIVQGTSPIKLPFGNLSSITLTQKTTAKSVGSVTTATTAQNVLTAFSALKAKLPQQKSGFKSLAKELGLVATTAPSISEMQILINNVIIPKIDTIIARLAKAEKATFSFTITKAMQGNPVNGTDETVSAGELYTLDAALNVFQVLFKIAGSYNFDIPAPYTYDTIGQDPLALINNPTTLTLNTGGAARMAGALVNARAAAAKAKLAYDTVVTRAAGVGLFDLSSWGSTDKTDFTDGLTKVTAALAGQYDVLDKAGVKIVTINATNFFNNPLTRAKLPTFAYDVPRDATLSSTYGYAVALKRTVSNYYQTSNYDSTTGGYYYALGGTRSEAVECNIEPASDLPDYTLNGILPGNTAANNVAEFNGILPMKSGVMFHSLVNGLANYNYATPNYMKSFATDGTYLYRLRQTIDTTGQPAGTGLLVTKIQKIDPATGEATNIAVVEDNVDKIIYANGQWWAGKYGWNSTTQTNTYDLYKFTSTATGTYWPTNTTPDKSIPTYQIANGWARVQALSGSGNFIYYVLDKGVSTNNNNSYPYTHSSEVHKLDTTNIASDTLITLPADTWLGDGNVAVYNFLYTSGGKNGIEKRDLTTGALVASYANGDFNVIIGGNFYKADNGKLITLAGTPAGTPVGGTAKAALAKYFGF